MDYHMTISDYIDRTSLSVKIEVLGLTADKTAAFQAAERERTARGLAPFGLVLALGLLVAAVLSS